MFSLMKTLNKDKWDFYMLITMMLSKVQFRIIDTLRRNEKPLGIRLIAKLSDCSVSEVWRQIKNLEKLNIVISKRYGKYQRYVLNDKNPLAKATIEFITVIRNYSWLFGKDVIEAIKCLNDYYVSGFFAVKGFLESFVVPDRVLLVVGKREENRARRISNWFDGVCKIDIMVKDIRDCVFFRDAFDVNVASVEQAIADTSAVFDVDPTNNVEVLLLILYRRVNYSLLAKLLEYWSDQAKYRVWFVAKVGRVLSLPVPVEIFRPSRLERDKEFEDLVVSRAIRLVRSGQIVRDKGW